ncbi:MAG: hypothetical protein V1912_00015 [bacterium]
MAVEKRQFLAYEAVRRSGLTDMSDAEAVAAFARHYCDVELSREDVAEIVRDYAQLKGQCTESKTAAYVDQLQSRDLDIDGEMDLEEGW